MHNLKLKITNTLPAFLFSKITRKFKVTKKQIGFIFLCDKNKSHATLKFYKKANRRLVAKKENAAYLWRSISLAERPWVSPERGMWRSLVVTVFLDVVVFFFKSSAKSVFAAFAVIAIGGNIIKWAAFTININTIRVGE